MNQREFSRRRNQLMKMIGANSIVILPAAPVLVRNRDAEHKYRQDSDFHYLTGFPEPESVAVLIPGRDDGEFVLFCRERDRQQETWTGRRAGPKGAQVDYGADEAFPIGRLDDLLPKLMESCDRICCSMGNNAEFDQQILDWMKQLKLKARAGVQTPIEIMSLDHYLHDMRLYKSRSEIKTMRDAAKISSRAHKRAMRACRPGITEYQVEAELLHQFFTEGAQDVAYTSIVGGGANGCILHYVENRDELQDGDLVLIDAGCELDLYASDITRTFPVNGTFSTPQKQIYELVLAAQEAAIAEVKPGNTWNDAHEAAVKVLTRGLVKLGILKGRVPVLIKNGDYKPFYMHRTGHWLGMDVHDVGDYKVGGEWRVLEPGMVLTVEPGLYIPARSKGVAKKWWNIGVRIEDDVVVTHDGCDVLSKDAPKTVNDIEALMAG